MVLAAPLLTLALKRVVLGRKSKTDKYLLKKILLCGNKSSTELISFV